MLYLVSDYKNPYFNIALEEYLFSSDDFGDDIIIVWRNEESIFLGKNQYFVLTNKESYMEEFSLFHFQN